MIKKITTKVFMIIAVAAFAQQLFVSCDAVTEDKFIGLQLYSVREAMKEDPEGTVAKVGEMGYKFVETAGYSDGKFYGMEPTAFKALCEENGMQFLGSHSGQNVPDSTNWDETMAWWDKCIAAHKEAGVKWIVQPYMDGVGYESFAGLERYCEYFNAVGEKCNAQGIRFGYHNHAKEFTTVFEEQTVYDWMLQLTDPEKVMFQLDLYWIIEGGKDPISYFDEYPGRFYLWHIKDKEEVGASGEIDFEEIFANKAQAGVEYGIVEVEEYNFEPIVSVEKSLDFLQEADYVELSE